MAVRGDRLEPFASDALPFGASEGDGVKLGESAFKLFFILQLVSLVLNSLHAASYLSTWL